MAVTIAMDPGNATGIAVFDNQHRLIYASVIKGTYVSLHTFLADLERTQRAQLLHMRAVCELPQIYRSAQSKGDPNDLIGLCVQCGHLEALANWNGGICQMFRPRDWKGQTPKHITKQRTMARLAPHELQSALAFFYGETLEHNKWDAIGLGIWYLVEKLKIRA